MAIKRMKRWKPPNQKLFHWKKKINDVTCDNDTSVSKSDSEDRIEISVENMNKSGFKHNIITMEKSNISSPPQDLYENVKRVTGKMKQNHLEILSISKEIQSLNKKLQEKVQKHKQLETEFETLNRSFASNSEYVCKLCEKPIKKGRLLNCAPVPMNLSE